MLFGTQCLTTCPSKYVDNSTTNVCDNCPHGCQTCSASLSCLTCSPGYFMNSTTCVRICPIGQYPANVLTGSNTERLCQMCETGCTRCINSTFCLACQSNFTLFGFHCSSNQQDYYEWENGTYEECPSHCLNCRHQICTRCASTWILSQGLCVQNCPSNKFMKTVRVYKTDGTLEYTHDECKWRDPLC